MYSEIIVAGLAFLGTVLGSYFSNSKTTALISYRLEQLEEKVNKHNNVVERMALAEKELKTVWHNIDELKEHDERRNK